MSAPRKIWVIEDGMGLRRHLVSIRGEVWGNDPSANAYHHDDVVRELVEALERIADLSVIAASDMAVIALRKHRAALAKIAQEG